MKFIQQAYKGINEWWAYTVTIALWLIGWQFIGIVPMVGAAYYFSDGMDDFIRSTQDNFMSVGMDSNLFLLLMIVMSLGGLLGLFLGIKTIHKRKIITVLTSRNKIDWSRVFYSFSIWAVVGIVMTVISYFIAPEDYEWNFKPVSFLILVTISFLFLPIQTTMEEILFRGYLMQGFGTWFKKGFIALIVTSAIFGLLHSANPEVQKLGWITMVYYIGTGLVMGIFTIMDEGTELALGFHAANNIIAAILVTADWVAFQTDALLKDISEPSVGWEMFLPVFVLYPIMIWIFSKKYGWTNWKEKMFGTIKKPEVINESELKA
tara:strand:+ start:966 stop:1925 length:960 start_codon:yes stop_codon:yes gene_type:complete